MIIHNPVITGSFQINGNNISSVESIDNVSSSVVLLNDASASFSTRVSAAEGSVNSLISASSSYLLNTTDTLDGDLTVTGKITAQEFHTEFVSASIIYQSGSTQFGDSADDTHVFQGKLGVGTATIGAVSGALHIVGQTHNAAIDIENSWETGERYRLVSLNAGGFAIENLSNSNNELFKIDTNGNIGIGENSPGHKLDVTGTIRSNANEGKLILNSTATNGKEYQFISIDSGNFGIYDGSGYRLWINGSGYIGANNINPQTPLHVDGEIRGGDVGHYIGFGSGGSTARYSGMKSTDEGAQNVGLTFYTTTDAGVNNEDVLFLTHDGNVGIGTETPTQKLHVKGVGIFGTSTYKSSLDGNSGGAYLRFGTTADIDSLGTIGTYSSAMMYETAQGNGHVFTTGAGVSGTERMRIDASGNVLINRTSAHSGDAHFQVGPYSIYTRTFGSLFAAGSSHNLFQLALGTSGKIKISSQHNLGGGYVEFSFVYTNNGKSFVQEIDNQPYFGSAPTFSFDNSTGVVSMDSPTYFQYLRVVVEMLEVGGFGGPGVTFY